VESRQEVLDQIAAMAEASNDDLPILLSQLDDLMAKYFRHGHARMTESEINACLFQAQEVADSWRRFCWLLRQRQG